jgi:enoyl-CoA hydratase
MIDAQEALRIGLVNRVVAAAELMASAEGMLRQMLANAPLALAACIEAVDRGLDMPLEEALVFEATHFGLLAGTEDMSEGTRAFLEKRAAQFAGR